MNTHTNKSKVITQRDLADFQDLLEDHTEAKRRLSEKRSWLLQQFDQHAVVQPGSFELHIKNNSMRRITKAFLISLIGKDGYADLLSEAPPTVYRHIRIVGRSNPSSPILNNPLA